MIFIVAVLPVVFLGIFIYKKDKQKEPIKLLIKLFMGGIGSCFLVLFVSSLLQSFFPIFGANIEELNLVELIIFVFIGIALVEELCKWIFAYKISYKDDNFDEFYDAILYCIFVALGFACFENLLYVYPNGIGVGIARAILAIPGHAFDGMFMGYYLGLAKISDLNNKNDKNKNLLLSILVPTITHGIYDYCLMAEKYIIFLIFIVFMYICFFKKIKKISSNDRKIKYKYNYCSNCGSEVNSDFCPKCGRKNE